MDVYYHLKFQLCITSGSKVSRSVQNCKHTPGIECVQTPPHGIGSMYALFDFFFLKNHFLTLIIFGTNSFDQKFYLIFLTKVFLPKYFFGLQILL